jgi:hypothetical protein
MHEIQIQSFPNLICWSGQLPPIFSFSTGRNGLWPAVVWLEVAVWLPGFFLPKWLDCNEFMAMLEKCWAKSNSNSLAKNH